MIARFRVLLPYSLLIPQEAVLTPLETDCREHQVTVYPPRQARIETGAAELGGSISVVEMIEYLKPRESPSVTDSILVNDSPVIRVNMLQIDFQKANFDRHPPPDPMAGDPPTGLIFDVANDFLDALRSVVQAGYIKPLNPLGSIWRLDYLADDGSELSPEEGLIRGRFGSQFHWRVSVLNEAIWNGVSDIFPCYRPSTWDALLLDAKNLLPEVGPALVLAFTALETLIATTLDHLSSQVKMPAGLWQWINDRGDYRKEPSIGEQFDILLGVLAHKSLKDKPRLWEAFRNLKDARNSFVHEGQAVIGKNRKAVTPKRAVTLITRAREIARWVESLLPPEMRSPSVEQRFDVQLMQQLAPPSVDREEAA